MMDTTPLPMSSIHARRVKESDAEYYEFPVVVEAAVDMSRVFFAHHGSEQNYRPYLHGVGEVRRLQGIEDENGNREPGVFGYDIDTLTYPSTLAPSADMYYEFTDEQLVKLIQKGYFTKGYGTTSDIELVFDLPVRAEVLLLPAEQGVENSHPLVFVDVKGLDSLQVSEEISGYDMLDFLPDRREEIEKIAQIDREVDLNNGPVNDIFADIDFSDMESRPNSVAKVRPVEEKQKTEFQEMLQDFESKQADVSIDSVKSAREGLSSEEEFQQIIMPTVEKFQNEQSMWDESSVSEGTFDTENDDKVDASDSTVAKNKARMVQAQAAQSVQEDNVEHDRSEVEDVHFEVDQDALIDFDLDEKAPAVRRPKLKLKHHDPADLINQLRPEPKVQEAQAERRRLQNGQRVVTKDDDRELE